MRDSIVMNRLLFFSGLLCCMAFLLCCNQQRDKLEDMVLIHEGEFEMGNRNVAQERIDYSTNMGHMHAWMDEQPVHPVYLDSYYIDKYPVTNKQFKAFVLANPIWQKERINPKYHDGNYLRDWNGNNYPRRKGDHPVTSVSWYAAMAYAEWVGKRLPTEAEWEKAARGGLKHKRFPWENNIDETKANYGNNIGKTTPVDRYSPNSFGLYDMAGNTMDMLLDEYDAHYYSISPRVNPLSGTDTIQELVDKYETVNTDRVVRGGAWTGHLVGVRVADRNKSAPTSTGELGGFRCVKDVHVSNEEDIGKTGVDLISSEPSNGSKINPNTVITLRFDGIPERITVNQSKAPFSDSMVTVRNKRIISIIGIFTPGQLTLEVKWNTGIRSLVYNVEAPIAEDMVLIPGGPYSSELYYEWNKSDNTVNIDPFYMDRFEVTVGEYRQFVSESGHRSPDWERISMYSPTDKHPMIFVDWYDAMLYARWAGKRLPTAAEWDKAARGGLVGKKYPWGDTEPDGTQSNIAGKADKPKYTQTVGSFLPNGFGLYDMFGNVREWCLDRTNYDDDTSETNPKSVYGERIVNITTNFSKIRSARSVMGIYHFGGGYGNNIPMTKNARLGFRCVRPASP